VDAALEGLRGLGPAPVLAGGAGPSGSGRRVRLRAAEPTLTGLPAAMHEAIAARMEPPDRAMLASSHPGLRESLRALSTSDRTVAQGRQVNSMAGFLAVLQDAQSLHERPDLQARPLATLAGRVEAIPLSDRQSAFAHILATIAQAPEGHRDQLAVPLTALAECIAGLPEAARQQAFTQVRQQAEQLEPGLPQGVARALRDQIGTLPEAARWQAFSDLLQAGGSLAPGRRAEMLGGLAEEIAGLPQPARLPAAQAVLAAAGALAPQQRWPVLKLLGQQVHLLPEAVQPTVWGAVVRSVLAVPPGQLVAALAAMDEHINTLNDDEDLQLPVVPLMPAVLRELLAWLQRDADLPVELRVTMLQILAAELATLPPNERQAGFQRALHSVQLLPQQQRGPSLAALAHAISALPEAARQPAWQAAAQEVERLPPGHQAGGLAALSGQVGGLPPNTRGAAFNRVLQAHRLLPAEHISQSMGWLCEGCLALPRAQWPQALDSVLEESARLPMERHGLTLLSLGIRFCQVGPAAEDPIEPVQPGDPGPDVRALCFDRVLQAAQAQQHPSTAPMLQLLRAAVDLQLLLQPDDAAFLNAARGRIDQVLGA
jgi:hypothetical protein